MMTFYRLDVEAFTLTLDNHDATDLFVLPVSVARKATIRFDGADWQPWELEPIEAA
jgi:hypothetical protein